MCSGDIDRPFGIQDMVHIRYYLAIVRMLTYEEMITSQNAFLSTG